jgi:hypothetical protein
MLLTLGDGCPCRVQEAWKPSESAVSAGKTALFSCLDEEGKYRFPFRLRRVELLWFSVSCPAPGTNKLYIDANNATQLFLKTLH